MKRILLLSLALLLPAIAQAQPVASDLMGLGMSSPLAKYIEDNGIASSTATNNTYIKGANATPAGVAIGMLKLGAANDTFVNATSGKVINLAIASTPQAVVDATGITYQAAGAQTRYAAAAVITPATSLTPVAADVLTRRMSIIATAAPTAVYVELPVATANAGTSFALYNKGASPAVINVNGVVAGTDSINAGAAATPYACATTKLCECRALTSSSWVCTAQ